MKKLVVVAAAAVTLGTGVAEGHRVNRYEVLEGRCSQSTPKSCVRYAVFVRRHHFGAWHVAWMYRIPGCESSWNVYARNASGASGLYQFMVGTWWTTPYRTQSIWSAKYQSLAARWMILQGRSGEWSCR
jgi:hypothetical protein